MTQLDFFVFALYLAGTVGLGIYYAWRNTDVGQMFAAGHQSPWWVAGLSGFMTMFSAGTFVVWGGLAFRSGLVAVTVNLAYGIAAIVVGYFLAGRWRRMGISSPAEYVELRFGASAVQLYIWSMMLFRIIGAAIALYALAVLVCALIPLEPGTQFRDGQTGNLSVAWATLLFGSIIVLYTMLGGLWAVLMTDVVQFIILNLAVMATLILILAELGGIGNAVASLPGSFLSLTSNDYGWWFIAGWVAIHFFMVGAEWAFVQRFISVPTESDARKGAYLFGILYLISPIFWLAPPMFFQAIDPMADPEQAYILAAQHVLPAGMLGLVLAAMFSATASLISGQLNVFAGALTVISRKWLSLASVKRSAAQEVFLGRIFTIVLGVVLIMVAAMIPAIGGAERIVISTASLMVGPLVAPSIWGLLGRRVGIRAVWTCALVTGAAAILLRLGLAPDGWFGGLSFTSDATVWIAGNSGLADLLVGVAVPVAVLSIFHIAATHDAPGAGRIDNQIAQSRSVETIIAAPSEIPIIVASAAGASGLLIIILAIMDPTKSRDILLVFGAALASISALSIFVWLRARSLSNG